ncbi:hypothetical protein [Pendulispora albinea]|uniref:Lipoprotein n=1 Tax=Pendulispora albinea TaxID=2741071 RepID=A0ABZ2M402_9BACT
MITFVLAACGLPEERPANLQTPTAPAGKNPTAVAAVVSDGGTGSGPARSLEALGEEGKRLAAGMRVLKSAELSGTGDVGEELAAGLDTDACLRVAFSAAEAVVGRLEDDKGRVLAETPSTVTDGKLGERGPVCARRGETVRVRFGGAKGDVVVRYVAWTSR